MGHCSIYDCIFFTQFFKIFFHNLTHWYYCSFQRHPGVELSKGDLWHILSVLEGELQAREITIATLKVSWLLFICVSTMKVSILLPIILLHSNFWNNLRILLFSGTHMVCYSAFIAFRLKQGLMIKLQNQLMMMLIFYACKPILNGAPNCLDLPTLPEVYHSRINRDSDPSKYRSPRKLPHLPSMTDC